MVGDSILLTNNLLKPHSFACFLQSSPSLLFAPAHTFSPRTTSPHAAVRSHEPLFHWYMVYVGVYVMESGFTTIQMMLFTHSSQSYTLRRPKFRKSAPELEHVTCCTFPTRVW